MKAENSREAHDRYNLLQGTQSGYFECQLPLIKETEKGFCFNNYTGYLEHEKPVWIPKSQCEVVEHTDFGRRIFLKNWLTKSFK